MLCIYIDFCRTFCGPQNCPVPVVCVTNLLLFWPWRQDIPPNMVALLCVLLPDGYALWCYCGCMSYGHCAFLCEPTRWTEKSMHYQGVVCAIWAMKRQRKNKSRSSRELWINAHEVMYTSVFRILTNHSYAFFKTPLQHYSRARHWSATLPTTFSLSFSTTLRPPRYTPESFLIKKKGNLLKSPLPPVIQDEAR